MSNFDLKKYLAENRLNLKEDSTPDTQSRLANALSRALFPEENLPIFEKGEKVKVVKIVLSKTEYNGEVIKKGSNYYKVIFGPKMEILNFSMKNLEATSKNGFTYKLEKI